MVTTNSPYTRTTWIEDYAWNEIIQEVNTLGENPDPDGICGPLDPLEEVDEDQIWNKENVTEVQDRLMEICPDNEFTELLTNQPWTSVIIDEIKMAILRGWCGCEELESETFLGTYTTGKSYGEKVSPFGPEYNKCGGRVTLGIPGFAGQDECRYPSPCYDLTTYAIESHAAFVVINNTFREAAQAVTDWHHDREEELLKQREVEDLTEELLALNEQLIVLQNQLTACEGAGGDCSGIESQISTMENDINIKEAEIEEAKNIRDTYRDQAIVHLAAADAAATANIAALSSYPRWDSTTKNMVQDHLSALNRPWGLGRYPYGPGNYQASTWKVTYIYKLATNPDFGPVSTAKNGFFTPSGLMYSSSLPNYMGDEYFYKKECRHKCGLWESWTGDCTFGEWNDWETTAEAKSQLNWTKKEDDIYKYTLIEIQGTDAVEY